MLNYTDRRIFELLRPNVPIPEEADILTFPPASMPPTYRAIWYIYTRNLVQKGGNFTHFAKKDYPIFASIIDKVPHNIGYWVYQEMIKFRFTSRRTSQIPFASLISVILFHEKLWHLPTREQHEKPTPFGKHILNLMRINLEEGSDQSRAPPQSRPTRSRATQSRVQEAQSAPPPPQPSIPSDLDAKIKEIVDKAISDLTERVETEVGRLVSEVTQGHNNLVDTQEGFNISQEELKEGQRELKKEVKSINGQLGEHTATISTLLVTMMSLNDKMDQILKNQSMAASSSTMPNTASEPASSIEPEPTTLTTQPAPPSQTDHTSTPTAPPLFADDKGGEEQK